MKRGKKYRAAAEKIERHKKHTLEEAVTKLKEIAFAKFDETVELTMWLGVDPRKADQLVRGTRAILTVLLLGAAACFQVGNSTSVSVGVELPAPWGAVTIAEAVPLGYGW